MDLRTKKWDYPANSVLQKAAQPLLERAKQLYDQNKHDVRLFHTVYSETGSSAKHRRMVIKVAINDQGQNIRCIITDLNHAGAQELYQKYFTTFAINQLGNSAGFCHFNPSHPNNIFLSKYVIFPIIAL